MPSGETKLKVYPVTLTAKGLLPFGPIEPYGEFGIGGYITKLDVSGNLGDFSGSTKGAFGLHAGAGVNFNLSSNLFLGAEGRYLWAKPSFGGQDIKLIVLKDGRVKDFKLNTQCSAGNGYFLQSTAEGFGIPIIEALWSEVPVITTQGGCFPEAGGPDTCYVNTADVDALAQQSEPARRSVRRSRSCSPAREPGPSRRTGQRCRRCSGRARDERTRPGPAPGINDADFAGSRRDGPGEEGVMTLAGSLAFREGPLEPCGRTA